MVLPTRLRAACCGASFFFSTVVMLGALLAAQAHTPAQRQELAAALRQLDALERFVAKNAASAPPVPGERYHFDYPRLLGDLARVRAGIHDHLSPSRAQPRDAEELSGDYRQESPPAHDTAAAEAQP